MENKILNKNTTYYLLLFTVFCIAIILRLKFYLLNRPLWHDECSLALSIINKNIFGYFSVLEHQQSAPPIFMMITKLFTLIFGSTKEYALRLFPLLCGISSIPAFYFFSKIFINKKWLIIIANFLFAINYHLIYYCQEFKQYSADVLIVLLCFIFFSNIDLTKYSQKKLFILGIISAIIPMLSLPSAFVITAFIIQQICRKDNFKNILIFALTFFTGCSIYYLSVLAPQQTEILSTNYWNFAKGFFTLSILNNLHIISDNLSYHLHPNKLLLMDLILCTIGIYCVIKNRQEPHNKLLIFLMIIVTACSILKIYPFFERIALYFIPITLILITYPLNYIRKNKKIYPVLIILLTIFGLSGYNFSYVKTLCSKDKLQNTIKLNNAREITKILLVKYNNTDYIIINSASNSEFAYYKNYYNSDIKNFVIVQIPEYSKQNYFDILNQLPLNTNYWFYYPYDYSKYPVIQFLREWKTKYKTLFEQELNGSYLLYLRIE